MYAYMHYVKNRYCDSAVFIIDHFPPHDMRNVVRNRQIKRT